jgi:hypothetical protein
MNTASRALILFSCVVWICAPALGRADDRDESVPLPSGWRTFKSPEGRFSAPFPSEPVATTSTHRTLLGPIHGALYAADLGDLRVSVELHDLPRLAAFLLSTDTILERARKGLLEGVGGRAIDERSVVHRGYPARETRYALTDPPSAIERALLVLVENRLYIAIATWSEPAPSDAPLARFFESFEVWAP